MAANPHIQAIQVEMHYGSLAALEGVSFSIEAGERLALVGPSGAGKTTLLNLINGSYAPSRGVIRVLGADLAGLSPPALRRVQRKIGTIYQQFHLVDNLRVVHNINAGHLGRWPLTKALFSLIWPQETERAAKVLAQVGIPEKLYARTGQLSGGQQQRVAIARVLIQNPEIILADEPVASLDPARSREIIELLVSLSRAAGKTLIASLHTVELALECFERVIGLRSGKVVFDLPADGVTPAHIQKLYRLN